MDFELDGNGLLREPNIHDGYLLAIELPEKGIARLTTENLSPAMDLLIQMEGVNEFLCDGFAEGNISARFGLQLDESLTTGRSEGFLGAPFRPSKDPTSASMENGWTAQGEQLLTGKPVLLRSSHLMDVRYLLAALISASLPVLPNS